MNARTTYATLPPAETQIQNPEKPAERPHSFALGYLRAFVTVLVVAHHALLAYHPYAPQPSPSFSAQPMLWRAFPVVDSRRWPGTDLFTGFNDTFFMALMFFLSGLFVWPALTRKGAGKFLRDRFLRLGLPFVVAAGVLAPLAYFPAYLVTGAAPNLSAFWQQWKSLGSWPAGPAWFLWVLLAFDCGAALLSRLAPGFGRVLGPLALRMGQYPIRFFAVLVCLSAIAYVPMALVFDPTSWLAIGPFSVQTSRIVHYAVYFVAGIAIGAQGIERGLLAQDGRLARRWPWWLFGSLIAFGCCIILFLATLASLTRGQSALGLRTIGNLSFVICCATASLTFLGVFLRYVRRPRSILDSLSANAYGIYLTHYAIVSWLQYALLSTPFSGWAKGCFVLAGALALSWAICASLRSLPGVARVI